DVREGWTVSDVWMEGYRAKGVLAAPSGEPPRAIESQVVVDASGRDCLLARRMGWRRPDPALNKVAHYTQLAGGQRSDGAHLLSPQGRIPGATTTDVHTFDGGWLWYIPLRGDIVSVGAVLDAHRAGRLAADPEAVFGSAVAACPRVREQLAGARRVMPVQT